MSDLLVFHFFAFIFGAWVIYSGSCKTPKEDKSAKDRYNTKSHNKIFDGEEDE